MNVCLISREYPPFFGGGIGTYGERYAWALASHGHHAIVVTVSGDGREHREAREFAGGGSVVVVRLPFIRGNDWSAPDPAIATREHIRLFRTRHPVSLFAKVAGDALAGLSREFRIDVIEAPDTGALAWYALDRARRGEAALLGIPIVTMVHSPSAWVAHWNREPVASAQDRALVAMEREQAAWSDAIACPSRALAGWAEERWNLARGSIEVMPYPLGPLEARALSVLDRAEEPRGERSAGATARFVFVGRLEPRKGVDTLLKGTALALQRGAAFHLDLIGQDMPHPERRGERFGAWCLREFVPETLRDRVRLLGRMPPERLASEVERADAAVIPSPMDNFPITCMEAMSAGRLVVAARAGGMGEMIEDGVSGVLFTAGDGESCAGALARAASMAREEASRLGTGAARRMLDLCGNERVLSARIDGYERAIERLRADGRARGGAIGATIRRVRGVLRL